MNTKQKHNTNQEDDNHIAESERAYLHLKKKEKNKKIVYNSLLLVALLGVFLLVLYFLSKV